MAEAARAARYRVVLRDWERPPFVALDGDWEAYESTLDGKLRRDLARRTRRLAEEGAVTFDVHDGTENLEELLDEGYALEPSGWKASRGTAIVSQPETREFYTGLARWAANRGTLRLSFLRLDGRPLAFQFGFEENRAYYFLKGGYAPAYKRFAPMKLLLRSVLQNAFVSELERFEFLGPPEPFKLEWTSTCHDLKRVELFDRSARSTGSWFATAFARPAAKKIRGSSGRRSQARRHGLRGRHALPHDDPKRDLVRERAGVADSRLRIRPEARHRGQEVRGGRQSGESCELIDVERVVRGACNVHDRVRIQVVTGPKACVPLHDMLRQRVVGIGKQPAGPSSATPCQTS